MDIEKIGRTLEIAEERQFTLTINGFPYHIMCTPLDLESMVLGFIVTEGFTNSIEKVEHFELDDKKFEAVVKINNDDLQPEIRSSGCIGIFRECEELKEVYAKNKYSIEELRESLGYLDIDEYKRTRGYHVACIVDKKGLIRRAYDVGRHNAVDKVVGMCLKENIDFSTVFLLISGRISRGMALKCVRAGIPLIVSKAAIFDSAIEVCKKTGLSAVSFATNIVVKGKAIE
ncbi:formate dehydrogenase accessory sulfurtransferase FdhD [Archaeoglobales archaeon]|nr:MAG: formate dehydrogenase accessory sulfurtransferase FdhD [Archaeoglobales archaeon]